MTVTLTMDTTLSRVRVTADALTAVDRAIVQRSTDQVRWTTVRGGADVALTGGSLLLPGTAGNYASTPDNAALDIVGDIDLRVDATLASWFGTFRALVGKYTSTGNQRSYLLSLDSTGKLALNWSTLGTAVTTAFVLSTVPVVPATSGRLAVRVTLDVDNGAAGNTVTFYTAPNLAGPWTQLGAPVISGGTTSIFSSTAILEVGSADAGTGSMLAGTVHAATVRSGIGGTVVAAPNFEFLPAATTSFTDGTGRVWTLNGTASIPTRQFVTPVDDYEFAPGVFNYYRVAPTTQPSGLLVAGIPGSSATTPDNAALDIVGDIDIRADVTMADWSSGFFPTIISKWNQDGVNQKSYLIQVSDTGQLIVVWSPDGTAALSASSTVPIPAPDGSRLAIRVTLDVDNGAAGRTATFYTAGTIDGTWVQLGAPVVQGGVTSIFSGNAQVQVSGHSGAAIGADELRYTVHAVEIRNGIGGTAVANPVFTSQSFGATGFTDAAGRVWTVNRAMILTPIIATTTPTLDRIWLKSVVRPFLNRAVTVTNWSPVQRPARASDNDVVSRTLPIAVTDMGGSRRFTLELYAATHADAQTLDYIMASGDVLFLHTPLGCEVPGPMFVRRDTSSERRPRAHAKSRVVSFPVVEVAAPGPDVVGAVGTWNSVLAAYATWDAVLAAFPTWDDLLAFHGSPSEVIVP